MEITVEIEADTAGALAAAAVEGKYDCHVLRWHQHNAATGQEQRWS